MRTRAPIVFAVTLFFLGVVLLFLLVLTPSGDDGNETVDPVTSENGRDPGGLATPFVDDFDPDDLIVYEPPREKPTFLYDGRVGDYGRKQTKMPTDIEILYLKGNVVKTVKTDNEGRFSVRLPKGDYAARTAKQIRPYWEGAGMLLAKDKDYINTDVGLFKVVGEDIDSETGCGIEGIILDSVSGNPVPGVRVKVASYPSFEVVRWSRLFGDNEAEEAAAEQEFGETFECISSADGRYRFTVPPGVYVFKTYAESYRGLVCSKEVIVRCDRFYQLNLVLIPYAIVNGRVTDTVTEAAVEGARVRVGGYSTTSDRKGFYAVKARLGTQPVVLKKKCYSVVDGFPEEIVVTREGLTLDITMRPHDYYVINGRVFAGTETLPPKTRVYTLVPRSYYDYTFGPSPPGRIDNRILMCPVYGEGGYTVEDAGVGIYVWAAAPGYFPVVSRLLKPAKGVPGYCELHLKPCLPVKVTGRLYNPDKPGLVFAVRGRVSRSATHWVKSVSFSPVIYLDDIPGPLRRWTTGHGFRAELTEDQAYSIELPPGTWLIEVNRGSKSYSPLTGFREIVEVPAVPVFNYDIPLSPVAYSDEKTLSVRCKCVGDAGDNEVAAVFVYYRERYITGAAKSVVIGSAKERKIYLPLGKITLIAETPDGLYRSDPVMVNVTENVDSDNPPEVTLVLKPVR